MTSEILEYIKSQRICVLAVETTDGSPHAATVHFAHATEPLMFMFQTERDSLKAKAILEKGATRASVVIGSDEKNMRTLQMDGEVRLVTEQEKEELFKKVYLEKFEEKLEKSKDPDVVALVFTPKWWRFTDWLNPKGKTITSSED